MTQQIVMANPPMIDQIDKRFGVKNRTGIIYSWGDKIYNPSGVVISPQLIAHESVHGLRQGEKIAEWWEQYIDDPKFRLAEEIPAHQAEYEYLVTHAPSRQLRRAALKQTAQRLAAPLYGRMITVAKAKRILTTPS